MEILRVLLDVAMIGAVCAAGFYVNRQVSQFKRLRAQAGIVVVFTGLGLLGLLSAADLALTYIDHQSGSAKGATLLDLLHNQIRWPGNALAVCLIVGGGVMIVRSMADLDRQSRHNEAQLRRAVRLARLGHWVWDQRIDKCIYCSPEHAAIFGVSVQEYLRVAQSFEGEMQWYPETEKPRYYETVHNANLSGNGYEIVTAIRRADGALRFIHELAECETDENGKTILTYGTTRDITDEKLLEESLRSANQAKSDFLAHMSHELRTPLNSILGFADILREELMGPIENEQYKQYITHIATSGEHLHSLLTDILDLSKIEAGAMELAEEVVDLKGLIAASVAMSEGSALKKALRLDLDLPDRQILLLCDERMMRQAVFNILSNAIRFSPNKDTVSVRMTADVDAGVDIVISDRGPGIPQEDLHRVLQPFAQSNTDPKLAQGGTGLGLSLSLRIMELHGGTLRMQSGIDRGTTVTLHLPGGRWTDAQPAAEEVATRYDAAE